MNNRCNDNLERYKRYKIHFDLSRLYKEFISTCISIYIYVCVCVFKHAKIEGERK